MKKVFAFIVHEFKEMVWITLYFLFAFGFVALIKFLVLSQNKIEYYRVIGVLAGAAIMSKIIMILDKTKLAKAFKEDALYKNILFKTVLYTVVAVLFVWLEHAVKIWINADYNWAETLHEIQTHRDPNQMALVISASFVTLLIYNTFGSIREYLGEKSLMRWLLKAKIKE
ncbi:hypothetical protein [Lutimonas sp.]|uniref:hypothetical protein n=1 Tax=Lutimonas sp. TaxID=1872403 RepID=UPI003D9B53C0